MRECLCVDWNKYNSNYIITGSAGGEIRVWDLRSVPNNKQPLIGFQGHKLSITKVKCNPFNQNCFATASYDMRVNIWDMCMTQTSPSPLAPFACTGQYGHHSEFITGLDWSSRDEHLIASCSWDRSVNIWKDCSKGQFNV
nr:peroxin-7 [Nephromyces sp. MMRI]AZL94464.1 peroxin-7 [Nephromyces sp. MMRI]